MGEPARQSGASKNISSKWWEKSTTRDTGCISVVPDGPHAMALLVSAVGHRLGELGFLARL